MSNIKQKDAVEYFNNDDVYNFINGKTYGLSLTTLFHVSFSHPKVFNDARNPRFRISNNDDFVKTFNIYATAINMPSKQLMTGQIVDVGTPMKYATGVGYGSINITFQQPRNHLVRSYFEEWMNSIIADSNTYVSDYDDYVCSNLRIYKLEKGKSHDSVDEAGIGSSNFRQQFPRNRLRFRVNEIVACMELRNVFPQNLGTTQLNQRDSRLSTLTVGLSYERYRFFNENSAARSNGTYLDNVLDRRAERDGLNL